MKVLLDRFALLLALFCARIEGDDPEREIDPPDDEPEGEPDPDADRDGDPDEGEDDLPESDDDDAAAAAVTRRPKTSREVDELRERTRRLENEIEVERAARRAPAGPSAEQLAWEKEQRLLDDAATSAQDRHAIETNRALRQSHALSQAAHARSEDLADQAQYNLKAMDNPVYRKMADRVEVERQRIAANGRGLPPREVVLKVLLGEDMLKGKVVPAKAKGKVTRTQTARPRSDIAGKSGRTEADKRRARLENQVI